MALIEFTEQLFEKGIIHYMTNPETVVVDESHSAIIATGHANAHEYSRKVMQAAKSSNVKLDDGSTTRTVFIDRK